jgi:hypothetical protein
MCELNKKSGLKRIDPCIKGFIERLDSILPSYLKIVACCCGHEKYKMSIVIKQKWNTFPNSFYDLVSGVSIPRIKRFYKKDKEGYYYIPEVVKE